jgi:hypothetical protein
MDVFEFMKSCPILTFFLALICGLTIKNIVLCVPNRIMRHWNIRKHGYPPPHCDADGDFKPEKDEN